MSMPMFMSGFVLRLYPWAVIFYLCVSAGVWGLFLQLIGVLCFDSVLFSWDWIHKRKDIHFLPSTLVLLFMHYLSDIVFVKSAWSGCP